MQKTLRELKTGQSGTVVSILGGKRVTMRLQALGILPGKRITKVSEMLMHGPVVIDLEHSKVALGFGISDKVLVEVQG